MKKSNYYNSKDIMNHKKINISNKKKILLYFF